MERVIYIENDATNLDLQKIHDVLCGDGGSGGGGGSDVTLVVEIGGGEGGGGGAP